jgi:hypothetical protein
VEEVGSSEVGSSGKVRLSEKVVLVLIAIEAGPVKGGSGFLPSRPVLGCAIKAGVVELDSGSCCQGGCGFLKQIKGSINLASGTDPIHGRCGRQSRHGSSWCWVCRCLTGRLGLDSLHALQPGQVWVRFRALQVGLVSRSGGGTTLVSDRAYHRWSSGVGRS